MSLHSADGVSRKKAEAEMTGSYRGSRRGKKKGEGDSCVLTAERASVFWGGLTTSDCAGAMGNTSATCSLQSALLSALTVWLAFPTAML